MESQLRYQDTNMASSGKDEREYALESIVSTESHLCDVYESLQPILETDYDKVLMQLKTTENAKLNISIAYSIASLYYVMLRSQV